MGHKSSKECFREAHIEWQYVPVSTEGDTNYKIQLIDIIYATTISENRLINSRNKWLVVTSTDPTPCQVYQGHIQQRVYLQNLDYPNIPIDQVIEEASKCVLACCRTRETNMSATKYKLAIKQNDPLYWSAL